MTTFIRALKLLFGKKSLSQREELSKLSYRRWQREKAILETDQQIREEKHDLKTRSWNVKLPFAKALAIFLFINFTILEIFTGWVTVQSFSLAYAIGTMPDFTPLVTLLGAILGQTISYGIYSAKSKAENTKGGIVYDMAMIDRDQFIDDQPQPADG